METDSLLFITLYWLLAIVSSLSGLMAGYLSPRLAELKRKGNLIKLGLIVGSITSNLSKQSMTHNWTDLSTGGVFEALVFAGLFAGFYYWIGTTSWFRKLVS